MSDFLVFLCCPERGKQTFPQKTHQRNSPEAKPCRCHSVPLFNHLSLASWKGHAACRYRRKLCSWEFPSPPAAPGLLPHAQTSRSKRQLCGLWFAPLCSHTDSPPQTDHFGFLNVTGLSKEQPRVNSQVSNKNRHERRWRAGRRGNSLPPGFGNAPGERSLGDFSFPRRKMLRCSCATCLHCSRAGVFPNRGVLQALKLNKHQAIGTETVSLPSQETKTVV